MSELETPALAGTDVHVPAGSDYVSDRKFTDFPISPEVLKGVLELGYVTATPVQAATIEPALAGKDLVVRAKTGTGKTTAFGLPIIERVTAGAIKPEAIVLAPVRELAQQIAEELGTMATYKDMRVVTLVGGLSIGPQEQALATGAAVVVGTPGRILDLQRRGNLDLSQVRTVCLDEADEMLSMGFFEDVTAIVDRCPKDRQILLYSATISPDTERLINRYTRDITQIQLSTDTDNVQLIEHVLYETTPGLHKVRALLHLLDVEDPTSAIIFCNTREDTATVATFLDRQGLDVQILSGELSQSKRSQVMAQVKAGAVRFLVSTDVAARGIDISDLSHVVNYSLPNEAAVYLHRAGRTGRIGKEGTVISLVGGTDMGTKRTLENVHKIGFIVKELPSAEMCIQSRVDRQARQIREASGTLVFESYLPTVRALMARPDGEMLLAAALRGFFQWDRERRAQTASVDSLGELRETRERKDDERRAKREGGRDGDRRRDGDRKSRDDRPRRDDRSAREERPAKPKQLASVDDLDLDALLLSDDSEPAVEPASADASDAAAADAKKKRRRRKKKSSGSGTAGAELSDDGNDDAGDDLDALLQVD